MSAWSFLSSGLCSCSLQSSEDGGRVVVRRTRSCHRHQGRPNRHSYHEGSGPNSYLLTAVLIHSVKHSNNQPCESSCHICNNIPYEQLEALLAKGTLPTDNNPVKARSGRLSPVLSVGTEGESSDVSSHRGSITKPRASFSQRRSCRLEEADSSSSCRPESSSSFYSARDGTLTESIPDCISSSWTDGQTDSYYPADSLTDKDGLETDDDDTLCEDLHGNESDSEFPSIFGEKESDASQGSPCKRARICKLGKKVGAMKLRPRQTFSEAWKGGKRPVFRQLNSHDGSVRRGNRCNSLTSLPSDGLNMLHNPRLLGRFPEGDNEDIKEGPMMVWPLRRSISTSPSNSFFSWEEVCHCMTFPLPVSY